MDVVKSNSVLFLGALTQYFVVEKIISTIFENDEFLAVFNRSV